MCEGLYEISRVKSKLAVFLYLAYAVSDFISLIAGYSSMWSSTEDSID
jgi:hypothetical protein